MTPGRRSLLVVAVLSSLMSLPSRAHAFLWPDFIAGVGAATAVEGGSSANSAAFSASAAVMWPFEEPYRFGFFGFTDDLGEELGRLHNDQGQDLGPTTGAHRKATGLGWRAEVHHPLGAKYELFGLGTWAYYRIEEDVRGQTIRRNNTPGIGLGIGAGRALTGSQWLGLTLTYRQLWRGLTQRYLTVAAEWRWHRSTAE